MTWGAPMLSTKASVKMHSYSEHFDKMKITASLFIPVTNSVCYCVSLSTLDTRTSPERHHEGDLKFIEHI